MKDVSHHLKHLQKKVIQSVRKDTNSHNSNFPPVLFTPNTGLSEEGQANKESQWRKSL
jgi:hypothetical protein